MTSNHVRAAVAVLVAALPASAVAQRENYGTQSQAPRAMPQGKPEKTTTTTTVSAGNLKVSKDAHKALMELKAAVDANETAAIPAKVAAAEAAAKTPADRYIIAQLQLQAAAKANDSATIAKSIQTMLDTGLAPADQVTSLTLSLAKTHYGAKRYDAAAAVLDRVLATNANDADALALLAETRNHQNRPADAVAALQKALKARQASGTKAPSEWYKRAVALAYNAKLPVATELSREWVAAYPSAANWSDALKVYRGLQQRDEAATLDTLRLARATGALGSESDYHIYLFNAVNAGAYGEAKAVLDEALASGKADPTKAAFKEAAVVIREKIGSNDPALLAESAKAAMTGAAARPALRTADALYGLGDYAKAAELYKAALGKSGADANLLNMRLGMALARAGDKAGATAAFNAVSGPQAELAKYWLLYLTTRT